MKKGFGSIFFLIILIVGCATIKTVEDAETISIPSEGNSEYVYLGKIHLLKYMWLKAHYEDELGNDKRDWEDILYFTTTNIIGEEWSRRINNTTEIIHRYNFHNDILEIKLFRSENILEMDKIEVKTISDNDSLSYDTLIGFCNIYKADFIIAGRFDEFLIVGSTDGSVNNNRITWENFPMEKGDAVYIGYKYIE
jgi:hypothetical protein